MTTRGIVVDFAERPEPGPLQRVLGILRGVLGHLVAVADVLMLMLPAGYQIVNAAGGAGTALAFTRVLLDLADAGVDQCRLSVRGNNSAAGSINVTAHDVTNNVELCRVTVTGAGAATYAGAWTSTKPSGSDQEVELRVIGDGTTSPTLFRASLQMRTLHGG